MYHVVYLKGATDVENCFHNSRQLPNGYPVARATYDMPTSGELMTKFPAYSALVK